MFDCLYKHRVCPISMLVAIACPACTACGAKCGQVPLQPNGVAAAFIQAADQPVKESTEMSIKA